jgi:hypothetical protein
MQYSVVVGSAKCGPIQGLTSHSMGLSTVVAPREGCLVIRGHMHLVVIMCLPCDSRRLPHVFRATSHGTLTMCPPCGNCKKSIALTPMRQQSLPCGLHVTAETRPPCIFPMAVVRKCTMVSFPLTKKVDTWPSCDNTDEFTTCSPCDNAGTHDVSFLSSTWSYPCGTHVTQLRVHHMPSAAPQHAILSTGTAVGDADGVHLLSCIRS